eukprot:gnl/TRDRNA2_/TRDRNA2_100522_c0_seq1.p1 gnl/TRDRNA2_/TRDRNA2_100522_c0~~gnl/TRDRNA2_/TRDRNA2_100522_c0_seq1.p1  ORF type:complete len:265 (+),score=43.38 gnl/TRDRNA2_/TRDRNA2_100522_c0_seq1:1-795(+)
MGFRAALRAAGFAFPHSSLGSVADTVLETPPMKACTLEPDMELSPGGCQIFSIADSDDGHHDGHLEGISVCDDVPGLGCDTMKQPFNEKPNSVFASDAMQRAHPEHSEALDSVPLAAAFPVGVGVSLLQLPDDVLDESVGLVIGMEGSQVRVRFCLDGKMHVATIDPAELYRVPWCVESELWVGMGDGSFVWKSLSDCGQWTGRLPVGTKVRLRIPDDDIPEGSHGEVHAHDADGFVRVWFEACKASWLFRQPLLQEVGCDDKE